MGIFAVPYVQSPDGLHASTLPLAAPSQLLVVLLLLKSLLVVLLLLKSIHLRWRKRQRRACHAEHSICNFKGVLMPSRGSASLNSPSDSTSKLCTPLCHSCTLPCRHAHRHLSLPWAGSCPYDTRQHFLRPLSTPSQPSSSTPSPLEQLGLDQ